ncbi:MAG TPA: RagB/SusD family nutrient uptake outer membrane protein, partial [Chitinophagaceae bacterium]|nr:RagB/SusD family nutrient uptake outer membrane protein [Chitinophagaceae bacterium]
NLVSDPIGYTLVDAHIMLGDEVTSIDPYYTGLATKYATLFRYEDVVFLPDQDSKEITVMMQRLYQYNAVATGVMDATGGTLQQKQAIYAEARANWAWITFYLVNMFAKPYNAATAATDPGYPIVRDADVTETHFDRGTVQQVYDTMVNDLKSAIPLLPIAQFTRARMCRAAAETLLGKVYLFMGKYPEALTQLNAAFADLPGTNTAIPMALMDLNVMLATGGPWGYNPATTPGGLLSAYTARLSNTETLLARGATNNYSYQFSDFLCNAQTYALFGSSDMRLRFFSRKPYLGSDFTVPGVYRRIAPGPTSANLGLHLMELYLMRAECRARTNDLAGAKADLEALRIKRMPAADAVVPAGLTQLQMIQFVIDERRREFAMEGLRWFDMRRLSVDPLFSSNVYTHTYWTATGAVGGTFTLRPERFTLQLPQKVIDQNPGMQNNP